MNKFKLSKFTIYFFVASIIFVAIATRYINSKQPRVISFNDKSGQSSTTTGNSSVTAPASSTSPSVGTSTPLQPSTLNLPIPFTSQAPTANWDELHNEACEEASAIMANAYLTGNTNPTLPASQVEKEISNLTTWQDQNFGYHLDTTLEETAQMIESVYGLHAKVVDGYSLDNIKDELNQNHVVILPVNGQIIGNPNYKQPGPIYHMLVVRGYTREGLITNDSGTRNGQNYPYTFETLYNAGADWNHTTNTIDQTKKTMLVVWK